MYFAALIDHDFTRTLFRCMYHVFKWHSGDLFCKLFCITFNFYMDVNIHETILQNFYILYHHEDPVFHDLYLHVRKTCFAVNGSREYTTNWHHISKIFVAKKRPNMHKNDMIDLFTCIAYKHHALAWLNIKITRTSWKKHHKHEGFETIQIFIAT